MIMYIRVINEATNNTKGNYYVDLISLLHLMYKNNVNENSLSNVNNEVDNKINKSSSKKSQLINFFIFRVKILTNGNQVIYIPKWLRDSSDQYYVFASNNSNDASYCKDLTLDKNGTAFQLLYILREFLTHKWFLTNKKFSDVISFKNIVTIFENYKNSNKNVSFYDMPDKTIKLFYEVQEYSNNIEYSSNDKKILIHISNVKSCEKLLIKDNNLKLSLKRLTDDPPSNDLYATNKYYTKLYNQRKKSNKSADWQNYIRVGNIQDSQTISKINENFVSILPEVKDILKGVALGGSTHDDEELSDCVKSIFKISSRDVAYTLTIDTFVQAFKYLPLTWIDKLRENYTDIEVEVLSESKDIKRCSLIYLDGDKVHISIFPIIPIIIYVLMYLVEHTISDIVSYEYILYHYHEEDLPYFFQEGNNILNLKIGDDFLTKRHEESLAVLDKERLEVIAGKKVDINPDIVEQMLKAELLSKAYASFVTYPYDENYCNVINWLVNLIKKIDANISSESIINVYIGNSRNSFIKYHPYECSDDKDNLLGQLMLNYYQSLYDLLEEEYSYSFVEQPYINNKGTLTIPGIKNANINKENITIISHNNIASNSEERIIPIALYNNQYTFLTNLLDPSHSNSFVKDFYSNLRESWRDALVSYIKNYINDKNIIDEITVDDEVSNSHDIFNYKIVINTKPVANPVANLSITLANADNSNSGIVLVYEQLAGAKIAGEVIEPSKLLQLLNSVIKKFYDFT